MHAHTYIHTYIHTHQAPSHATRIKKNVEKQNNVHVGMTAGDVVAPGYLYGGVFMCVCVCIYVHVNVCMYMYLCVYVCGTCRHDGRGCDRPWISVWRCAYVLYSHEYTHTHIHT